MISGRQYRYMLELFLVCLLWESPARAASLSLECTQGCSPADGDASINLFGTSFPSGLHHLALDRRRVAPKKGWDLLLYFGNPETKAKLMDEVIETEADTAFSFERTFSGNDLGQGTFITVLAQKNGNREEILSWSAFRLLTQAERTKELAGPETASARGISVTPLALRAHTARGDLPPNSLGDASVWFSLVDHQEKLGDIDLDGDDTGAPGLGI